MSLGMGSMSPTAAEWGYRAHTEMAQAQLEGTKETAYQGFKGHERTAEATEGAARSAMYGVKYAADRKLQGEKYGADMRFKGLSVPETRIGYHYGMTEDLSRAGGGFVESKQPYIVGEKGPELFVPRESGTIIPNHDFRMAGKPIPRAEGGPVFPSGGGDPVAAFKGFVDKRAAEHLKYSKDLMRSQAEIDPAGVRRFHTAASLAPEAAEATRVRTQNAKSFEDWHAENVGALPAKGEPDHPAYVGAHHAAQYGGLEEGIKYHMGTQQAKQYEPLFTPQNVAAYLGTTPEKATAFMNELKQNPADMRRYMLKHGPGMLVMAPAAPGPGGTSGDPAWQGFKSGAQRTGSALIRAAETFNRGVRQVVPGSSAIINERGGFRNPLTQ